MKNSLNDPVIGPFPSPGPPADEMDIVRQNEDLPVYDTVKGNYNGGLVIIGNDI